MHGLQKTDALSGVLGEKESSAALPRGRHSLSYRLKAEIPARFSALPTLAYGMYAPELRGNAAEIKVRVAE